MLFNLIKFRYFNTFRSHLQTFPFIIKTNNTSNTSNTSNNLNTSHSSNTSNTSNSNTLKNSNSSLHFDWFETDQEYNIETKLPYEIYRSNINLILKNHIIEIKIFKEKHKNENYLLNGLIYIPANVDEQFISARYIDDMIIIALPKLEKSDNEKVIDIE